MKTGKQLLRSFLFPAICIVSGCLLATGCSNSVSTDAAMPDASTGAAEVTIRTGKIGVLAKREVIEMKKLVFSIINKSDNSIILRDSSALTGYGEKVISKTYPALKAPEEYTLEVFTVDAAGKVIHSGSTGFTSIPGDTVNVSLDLDAKCSMLQVSFNAIPDSVRYVKLGIANVDTLDSVFNVGSLDTVKLFYDYLIADSDGVDHSLSLKAGGSYYGKDTVLYAADTVVSAISGQDKSYTITLKWVGPGVPDGAATITVTIGAVGTTSLNTGFGPMGGLSDLVDDLEDGDQLTRYNTIWWTHNDSLDGGKSKVDPPMSLDTSLFAPTIGGAFNSDYSACFTYQLDQGDNLYEPFAGMGFNLDTVSGLDISSATGIRFLCKGNAFRVRIHTLDVEDYGYYGYDVTASNDWKLVDLKWSQLAQPDWATVVPFDLTKVTQVSFEVMGETGDSGSVCVDDVYFPGFLR